MAGSNCSSDQCMKYMNKIEFAITQYQNEKINYDTFIREIETLTVDCWLICQQYIPNNNIQNGIPSKNKHIAFYINQGHDELIKQDYLPILLLIFLKMKFDETHEFNRDFMIQKFMNIKIDIFKTWNLNKLTQYEDKYQKVSIIEKDIQTKHPTVNNVEYFGTYLTNQEIESLLKKESRFIEVDFKKFIKRLDLPFFTDFTSFFERITPKEQLIINRDYRFITSTFKLPNRTSKISFISKRISRDSLDKVMKILVKSSYLIKNNNHFYLNRAIESHFFEVFRNFILKRDFKCDIAYPQTVGLGIIAGFHSSLLDELTDKKKMQNFLNFLKQHSTGNIFTLEFLNPPQRIEIPLEWMYDKKKSMLEFKYTYQSTLDLGDLALITQQIITHLSDSFKRRKRVFPFNTMKFCVDSETPLDFLRYQSFTLQKKINTKYSYYLDI